ncbi:MAG TPA: CoA-binding protein [bacterium]|nr:CoA-binding protein [bacterium]
MDQRLRALDYLFRPRSVAFVGATEKLQKWGFIVFNNLITGGYEGKLYPVNPGRETVLGLTAYPSVRDIPGEVDLAVFTVPAREVPAALDDCLMKRVKAGVVISAGFKELGGEWADVEMEMVRKARAGGMVLVGPNGQGICNPAAKLFAWMPHLYFPRPGKVAVISQSGNVQGILVEEVQKAGFGVSKGVSSGNEADLRSEDYYEYLANDPETEVILSYIEGVTDGRRFIEGARRAGAIKPIIALKGGRTSSGISAARSHTGAMAVDDRLFEAACRQAGIVRARTMDEAGIIAGSFLNRPLPRGKRVGIITGGGGLGVVAADTCAELGLDVVKLSEGTLARIGAMMPAWWSPGNPVDLVAGMNFQVVMPVMDLLMKSGEIDSLLLLFIGPPRSKEQEQAARNPQTEQLHKMWKAMSKMFAAFGDALLKKMRELRVPIYVVSNFNPAGEAGNGVPGPDHVSLFPTIESGCAAISAGARYHEWKEGQGRGTF